MKLAKVFVLGGLACILVLLELPTLNGRYLLVELEDADEIDDTAAAPQDPWPTGKTTTKYNKYASYIYGLLIYIFTIYFTTYL